MEFTLLQANAVHIQPCQEASRHSVLGDKYFPSEESARRAVKDGIAPGTMFVAMQGEDCAGFFYYLPNGVFHSFPYLHLLTASPTYRDKGAAASCFAPALR